MISLTTLKKSLCSALLLLASTGAALAQPVGTTVVVPGQPGHTLTTSTLSSGPDPSKNYQRVMAVYPPADVLGVGPGLPLRSLGFYLRNPAPAAVSGTLRIWLRTTTDPNYLLTNVWAYSLQNPTPFQQVYNGPLTIPAAVGWFDVAFQTPFAYAGGGFYLAYEWETTAPVATSGTYVCEEYLQQSIQRAVSATAFPTTLTQVSGYRPILRLGYLPPAQDAAVLRVYGPGKVAQQSCVTPYPVQAVVRNAGTQPLANVPVTFTPGAGTGQAVTVTIAALAVGAEASVRLPGLAPVASTAGRYVRYTVSVPADQNMGNDSQRDSTLVTARELTYTTGFPAAAYGSGYIGFNTATANSGTLLCRYPLRAAALVSSVRVRLSGVAANVGNTIFGIVLDEQGRLLGRSADAVITNNQNGDWLTLPLPVPVRATGRAFFAGLGQTRPRVAGQYYYPLANQPEPIVRDSAYYSVVGDSALTGLKPPREFRVLGRFMVEVNLESAPLAVRPAAAPWVDVWPVPAHDRLNLTLPASSGPTTATLLDATGRVVRPALTISEAQSQNYVDVSGLRPGVYVLRLQARTWQLHRRVVVE